MMSLRGIVSVEGCYEARDCAFRAVCVSPLHPRYIYVQRIFVLQSIISRSCLMQTDEPLTVTPSLAPDKLALVTSKAERTRLLVG